MNLALLSTAPAQQSSLLLTYSKDMGIFTHDLIVRSPCHAHVESETTDYDT